MKPNNIIRLDGRSLEEYRKPIKIETNISNMAEGSAKVTIGDTVVIAGVKMDVGEPYPDSPDEGVLIVTAELLPLSSPDFLPGPPREQATELARIVDRGIRESQMIDIKKLCIKEGELVWAIFLDIYTINDDGNLIDAAALASVIALSNTVLPKLEKDKVKYGEFTKTKLPLKSLPITCTLAKLDNNIIVDPNREEESLIQSRLSIAVNEKGEINAMQFGGNSALTIDEIMNMVDLAIDKNKELRKYVK